VPNGQIPPRAIRRRGERPAGLLQKKFERFADVPRVIRDAGLRWAELVFPGLYWMEGSCGLGAEQDAQTEMLL